MREFHLETILRKSILSTLFLSILKRKNSDESFLSDSYKVNCLGLRSKSMGSIAFDNDSENNW